MRFPNCSTSAVCRCVLLLCIALGIIVLSTSGQESIPSKMNCDSVPLAVKLYENGDTGKAIELFKQILKACPNNTEALYYLGLSYKKNGYLGGMRDAFTRLVQLQNETRSEVYADLAYAYTVKNAEHARTALTYAERAKELGVKPSVNFYWAIAETNWRIGKPEIAIEEANKALELDASYVNAYLTKYVALRSLGRYSEAASTLAQMLKLPEQTYSVWKDEAASSKRMALDGAKTADGEMQVFTGKEVTTKAAVTGKPEPSYTERARQADTSGRVTLRVVLGADGLIKDVLITIPSPIKG